MASNALLKQLPPLPTDFAPGTVVDNDFVVECVAGRGSFSTVYRASHQKWRGRIVALKVLHRGIQTHLERKHGHIHNPYGKEQMLCRRLNYPTFCKVLKVGDTSDGRHYAAMEWAHGQSLEERIAGDRSGLPLWIVATVIEQLGLSLIEMHIQRVIHRDIKPANIMLQQNNDQGLTVRVLDFGIGKLLHEDDSESNDSSMLVGTPAYMSPEQASGHETTPRSDIFALAAVSYEMLTGKRPIQLQRRTSESYVEYLTGTKSIPTHGIETFRQGVPDDVIATITQGLHRNASMRPSSVKAFLDGTLPQLKALGKPEPEHEGFLKRMWTQLFGNK